MSEVDMEKINRARAAFLHLAQVLTDVYGYREVTVAIIDEAAGCAVAASACADSKQKYLECIDLFKKRFSDILDAMQKAKYAADLADEAIQKAGK